ncbi:colorectal mutant cancer protein-like isoform X1 [Ruditapes philippinarum]|uniref:colorectal mutant cancer protein-like isoform X1 n=1 Tax=Ruditapes philippinarum TaxID=129788 RepID=UPI00295AB285|nr:colorectal mutant cancer protein-like isoform X1 [Ruditapes philippinarum]
MAEHISRNTIRDRSLDSQTSTESGSSSTSEEERLKKLFESCDDDKDGYLNRDNFAFMCKQLCLEEWTGDILEQLGVNCSSRISFQDFLKFRAQALDTDNHQLLTEDTDTGIDLNMSRQHTQVTSWPTMSSDSLGAISGRPDSLDYDSGARDLQSPEPLVSLQKMLESHDPNLYRAIVQSCIESKQFLDLANRLHQATITSLKGEIIELRSRLQRDDLEKDSLEKQLAKLHADRRNIQDDYDERLDEITFRYEERITELHSVIAELRKKIERHQINVIREEDEEDIDAAVSTKSQDGGSIEIGSQTQMQGEDLNSELSRVVTELESAIHERKKQSEDQIKDSLIDDNEDDSVEEKALEVCKNMEDFSFEPESPSPPSHGLRPATFHPPPPPPPNEFPDPGYLQEEINSLRTENSTLQEQIIKQEQDMQRMRLALANLTDEKNRYKKQASDHQTRLHSYEGSGSPVNSRTSTPTKQPLSTNLERPGVNLTPTKASDNFPVAKVAELKKLKTVSNSERPVLGSEISNLGMPNTKVAEHLVQSLWKGSKIQEIVQNATDKSGISDVDSRVTEFEIELERLQSQVDNYKSQIDVANLTLEESKANCDRLTVLIGKYESNNTALQIVLNYSQLCTETYEIICALLESELGAVLANCRAAGLGGMGGDSFTDGQEEIASILKRAHQSRRAAENVSKHMLQKLDKTFGVIYGRQSPARPWEDLSNTSKTASTSSSTGSGDTEFTKADERRLRDYIQRLKSEQSTVHLTVMELESVHCEPELDRKCKNDAHRLDLENAVIMQELMAMKEEKAELKAQNYLLEKEKRSLELRMNSMESQEHAYLVQIEHLKSEVTEGSRSQDDQVSEKSGSDRSTPPTSLAEYQSHDLPEMMKELTDSLRREKKLKNQVSELVGALEKLSRNSEIRHQQSAEFVNDLKRANSTLISAFDKAKKKYQTKLKKFEAQVQSLTERYESHIRILNQRLARQEEDSKQRVTNETSL